jgi:hypothetical protein
MDEHVVTAFELDLLTSNIKIEVCNVLDAFFSFLKTWALMLNLRYKNIVIIFISIGKELKIYIVEDYHKKTLFSMLLKTH